MVRPTDGYTGWLLETVERLHSALDCCGTQWTLDRDFHHHRSGRTEQQPGAAAAKLFIYGVAAEKIVREIVPIAQGRTTGLIAEVAAGRLLGLTTDREHADRSILYGVDVATGDVLFRRTLPSPVSTDAYLAALGGSLV